MIRMLNEKMQIDTIRMSLLGAKPININAIDITINPAVNGIRLSNLETSRIMNKSEAAIKMLISRGLQDLRERTTLAWEVEL